MKYSFALFCLVAGILLGIEADVVRSLNRAQTRVVAVEQDNLLLRRILEGKAHRRKDANGSFAWVLPKEDRFAKDVYRPRQPK